MLGVFFDPEVGDMILSNVHFFLTDGVISQKTELFITTAVRTSHPTQV
jgi:hypothetical protein